VLDAEQTNVRIRYNGNENIPSWFYFKSNNSNAFVECRVSVIQQLDGDMVVDVMFLFVSL
jgi:hypothetical protein